jgi:asparagine synthase (glutamine-hydrolysing)
VRRALGLTHGGGLSVCGICGTAGFVDRVALERMTAALVHRGPDDGGVFVDESAAIGLGNRRLAILDLSPRGHMPMSSPETGVTITYNGEIYNYRELRRDLSSRGHRFVSDTDTEVILRGYEEWGRGVLPRLNGIFALAVWDPRARELVLARDRFGVKPLYYTADGAALTFASEVKALIAGGYRLQCLDPVALHRYLAYLWVPAPRTLFPGVKKLEPATCIVWKAGRLTHETFWRPEFTPRGDVDVADLADELRELLLDAVRRQLRSDVSVGMFLSGGLDSTALLALASCLSTGPPRCFTIAFRTADATLEQSIDDARYAALAADAYGADLQRIEVAPKVVELLPKVVWQLDEPVADPAAIATLLISEAARPTSTVLLSGQGADEVFAGYRVHQMHRWAQVLAALPPSVAGRAVPWALDQVRPHAVGVLGERAGFALAVDRFVRKLAAGVPLPREARYAFYRAYYSDSELLGLYSPELRHELAGEHAWSEHEAFMREAPASDYLDKMLYTDWKTFLPELNLAYCDKLSMAASVETRVPYLDNGIVDFMCTVPAGLKLRGLTSKYLLREAVKDFVPSSILHRRKAGFGAPIRTWLRRDLREMVDDLLSPERIAARGYFDAAAVRRLIADDREGRSDNTYRIWALLTLEVWHGVFLDHSYDPTMAR